MKRIFLLSIVSLALVVGSRSGWAQNNINSDSSVQSFVVGTGTTCPPSLTEFIADGTFNLPECAGGSGLVLAQVQGGGGCGGGGGGQLVGTGGGGGAGAGGGQLVVVPVFVSGAVTVTIGAVCTAGIGGISNGASATDGTDGSNVLFGSVTALGGRGGLHGANGGGGGQGGNSQPVATAGDSAPSNSIPIQQLGLFGDRGRKGGNGCSEICSSQPGASSALFAGGTSAGAVNFTGGGGAATEFGSGGSGGTSGTPIGGAPAGTAYGAGGGGGLGTAGANGSAGGVGALGIVRVIFLK